jgi:hypothetical protein
MFHYVSQQHLKLYLAEFDYRYNERSALGVTDAQRTAKWVQGIVDKRLTYRRLRGAAKPKKPSQRLMTMPGVDMVVAVGLLAAIGPITHFDAPDRLVSYLGLNPAAHQSGESQPRHGRISKQGWTHARTMLVEAAGQAVRGLGPLRAFYERVARRRGVHIAAVAVARKIAVIIWHLIRRREDYAWVRRALHANGRRSRPRDTAHTRCDHVFGSRHAHWREGWTRCGRPRPSE